MIYKIVQVGLNKQVHVTRDGLNVFNPLFLIYGDGTMGLLDKAMGRAEVNEDTDYVEQYFSEGEKVLQSYHFIRDALILSNYGLYFMDVQGLTGKKVEVRFVPKTEIANISFETAGRLDFDVDIKIGLKHGFINNKVIVRAFHFKVPKAQTEEAKQIVKLVKEYYLIEGL